MRAENLKEWLHEMEDEKKAAKKGESGYKGAGNRWRPLIKLCKHVWKTGKIPHQMLLRMLVLVQKGNSGKFRGIGLFEVIREAFRASAEQTAVKD